MELWAATGLALRGTLCFAVSLSAAALLSSRSATLRRWVLLLGTLGALTLPVLSWAAAGRQVVDIPAPRLVTRVMAEAASAQTPLLQTGPAAPASRARASVSAGTVIGASWLLGAAWALGRCLIGVLGAHRLARRARVSAEGPYFFSADVAAPVVVGLIFPRILVPEGAADWQSERLRAVLLHESAHVRRRDGLALFGAQLACALYWFIPLSWLTSRRLRRECELAADEDVLAAGIRATNYAEHLLAIARQSRVPAGAVAMASRPSDLGSRIHAMIAREVVPAPLSRLQAALCAASALALLACVACTGASPTEVPVPPVAALVPPGGPWQSLAMEEATRVRRETGARRVAIVVLDSRSGRVVALSDDRLGDPIVPASTLKPLTVALGLDAGVIQVQQRFDCGNGQRSYGDQTLRDAGSYGELDAGQILAVSSNIGVSRIFDALGGERLRQGLNRFHVGAPADIPSAGLSGALVAIGVGSYSTPVAMASAYAVLANDGVYEDPGSARTERVLTAETARRVRSMLEGAVSGELATGAAARVNGVRVGGKTGTSDDSECKACAQIQGSFASFVGIAPIDSPRYVIYVGVGQPSTPGTGGTLAAPVFARLAARLLAAEH